MTNRGVAIFRVDWSIGSALLGGSLFPDAPCPAGKKVTKNALPLHPAIRFARVRNSLRSPFGPAYGCYFASLRCAPSLLRGSAYKGHPRPFKRGRLVLSPHPCGSPLYATIPLTLLKGPLAPPESYLPLS
jgi:hypothetical protein